MNPFASVNVPLRIALALAMASSWHAMASPFKPTDDSRILERLPSRPFGPSPTQERALRRIVADQPNAQDLAVRLAAIEVRRSQISSDPRPLGQAEALLSPWWEDADPPVPILMLRATIRQRSHQFAPARADLAKVVAREPRNIPAWFMLASIEQVSGHFDAAARACARIEDSGRTLASRACRAALDGVRGRAANAYQELENALARDSGRDQLELRTWIMTLQAELAERLGRPGLAERLYRQSLVANPQDTYSIAAYADFLLDQDRAQDVVHLIDANTPVDTLLLRRAQAAQRVGSPDAAAIIDVLGGRFAALRARGDRVHLREEARFRLELGHDPEAALTLAEANWNVQKEPLDARILLESAIAAGRPQAAAEVVRWIAETHLEGTVLARLVDQVTPS